MFETAVKLIQAGSFTEAEKVLQEIVSSRPRDFDALHMLGVVNSELGKVQQAEGYFSAAHSIDRNYPPLYQNWGLLLSKQSRFGEAIDKFSNAIRLAPNYPPVYSDRGNALTKLRRYDDAIRDHNQAIKLAPGFFAFYYNRGNTLKEHRQYAAALADYDRAIELNPGYAVAFSGRGNVFYELKNHDEALAAYDRALSIEPDLDVAWLGRGNVFAELKRHDEAFAAYDRALAVKPDLPDAWLGRGNVLAHLKRHDEAFSAYDKALSVKPDFAEAQFGRGNVFADLKRYDEACAAYDRALSINPDFELAWIGRGNALAELKRYDDALLAHDKALSIKSDLEGACLGRGNALSALKRYDEALAAFGRALSINPDSAKGWLGRGSIFSDLKRYDEAFAAYEQVLSIDPDFEFFLGHYFHARMKACDWRNFANSLSRLEAGIAEGLKIAAPFEALGLTDAPELHLRVARIYAESQHPRRRVLGDIKRPQVKDKIRIGYYSADFHNHATAHLMAGLFELHDKSRFELFGFSFGPGAEDNMRARVSGAFDEFLDVAAKGSRDIARQSRDLEIDIAVDLKGYTQDSRVGIFAEGCAPIQVAYLGYPGTMGADYIDYVIADRTVVPEENKVHFTEKVVWLPHSYQVNDSTRKISQRVFTRSELGLPEQGFVYCCFNNNFKILPSTFDSWMRILAAVEGSVLWLLEDNATAAGNLRREAASHGIDERRLVFAPRMQLDEHLARHRVADLFIDTLPYNAHTTASDALWAGVPVLTCMGKSFAGRVAASLLNAVGLPELVAHSAEDYEALAIELGRNPERLRQIRQKLDANRLTAPLFDTALFTRHLEAAYEEMHRRCQAGLPPDHIEVPADGPA